MIRWRNVYINQFFTKKLLLLIFLGLTIAIVVIVQLLLYDPDFSANKMCYTHKIMNDKQYSRSIEFFQDLIAAPKQPLPSDTIFFVDSNCSTTGLLDITPR